jgi:hypothetical protein
MQSACNQHAISMQSVCNQHAISMQSACNQYAISMQSVCNQHALRDMVGAIEHLGLMHRHEVGRTERLELARL